MIAYVEGRIAELTPNACVLVTEGGVGYELFLSSYSLSRLPARGEKAVFYAVTVVREDALELFGFESWDERETFLILTTINRVGPRTALAILGVFRPEDLRRIVLEDDVVSLTRVPGIGKKTGQQIFLELKYKLKLDGGPVSAVLAPAGGLLKDSVDALTNLGYEEDEALRAVKEVLQEEDDLDLSAVLRKSLKKLAGNRK